MSWFKKLFYIVLAFALIFGGLWLVVANDQDISLNLGFFSASHVNAGLVILFSFAVGCGIGVLVGFNLLELLKLNNRLYWLRREVRQLQDALGDRRHH